MKNLRSILFVLAAHPAGPGRSGPAKWLSSADVPFDFVVGDRAYPAGEYALKSALND